MPEHVEITDLEESEQTVSLLFPVLGDHHGEMIKTTTKLA